jgi:GntR family transcriptional regulator
MIPRDRRSLALQVRDEVSAMVAAGELKPGDQLPSEADLVVRFGVARTTVREALKLLEQDGLVHVQHGRGRFVAPSVERSITRLESVTAMMESLGYRVTNRVLSVSERLAKTDEATALHLAPGGTVVGLERVRLQGKDPLIYSIDVVPRALLGDLPPRREWGGSLGRLLASHGLEMASATAEIRAVSLDGALAQRIGWPEGSPWLLMVQTNFTRDGRPIIYSHDYHRGDVFTFNVLRRADAGAPRS